MAAANMISSSVTGDAPLSWGGKTIGTLFGLKTSNQEDLRQLQGVGQAVDDLRINQIEITSTMNTMGRKMETMVSAPSSAKAPMARCAAVLATASTG
jgi:hypothetical protein